VLHRLPEICWSGRESWTCECFLVFWEVVEYHTPQRVMRQFGMVQRIPDRIPITRAEHFDTHRLTLSGKANTVWTTRHANYISSWISRRQRVLTGVPSSSPRVEPGYMDWFWERTVLYVTDPRSERLSTPGFQDVGARSQLLVSTRIL
jgi:hypothetical protein